MLQINKMILSIRRIPNNKHNVLKISVRKMIKAPGQYQKLKIV